MSEIIQDLFRGEVNFSYEKCGDKYTGKIWNYKFESNFELDHGTFELIKRDIINTTIEIEVWDLFVDRINLFKSGNHISITAYCCPLNFIGHNHDIKSVTNDFCEQCKEFVLSSRKHPNLNCDQRILQDVLND